jgi:hypothetical protein
MDQHKLATYRLLHAEADLAYMLHCFGDELAKRHGYKANSGIEAVHFYLTQKHGWQPSVVRAMTAEDLRFSLSEEMHDWTLPADAQPPA